MKKIIFSLALAMFTGSVMAQTPEEKAAAKAAKAALKEATKKAKCVIRTGEITPYANIILHSNVFF